MFKRNLCFQANKPNKYVDASNFREARANETATAEAVYTEPSVIPVHPIPEPPRASPLAFQPEGLGGEFDKAYFAGLDVFVHDF